MKIARHIAALLIGLLILAPASAQPEVEGHLRAAEKVTDRVHVMRQPDRLWSAVVGNVTIIEQSDGVVLIDTGGTAADGQRVATQVRALTSKPVKAVALTHWHNDHPLGLRAIVAQWPGARIIATEAAKRRMIELMAKNVGLGKNDPKLDAARFASAQATIRQYEANTRDPALSEEERREYGIEARYIPARLADQMGAYIVLPTETFADRLLLDDAEAPVELRFLGRANTDGDLIAWLPKQRVAVTGDIVVAPTPYGFNSYPADWIAVLERIKALGFAYLIPGHGKVQTDSAYLDMLTGSLRDVRAQVAPLAAQGLTLEQATARMDFTEARRRFAGDSAWAWRWLRDYWLEPITSSAWREAKGVPIEPGG